MKISLYFLSIFSFLVSFAIFASVDIERDGERLEMTFVIDDVNLVPVNVKKEEFLKASLDGVRNYTGIFYQEGLPQLPVIRFYVEATKGSDVNIEFDQVPQVLIVPDGYESTYLLPSQEPDIKMPHKVSPLKMDRDFYSQNKMWPDRQYTIENAGSENGRPKKLVTIFPLRYNPATNEYQLNKRIKISAKVLPKRTLPFYKKPTFAFIVGETFKDDPSVLKYKDFKETQGFTVKIININSSLKKPEQIREELQRIYNDEMNDLQYALIIGDVEHVKGYPAKYISGVTDHYYRTLDADYKDDLNTPDIGVGRITVKNSKELADVINKFIKYQSGDFEDLAWLDSVSFIATDDRYEVAEGTHNYVVENYTAGLGYTGVFPENPMAGGDKLYAITHNVSDDKVVSALKLGRSIVNYSGHGSTTYWAGPYVTQKDVRSFDHSDATPFVISNACITGQFIINESFGETWIKHPQGAIMFWGSMDNTYWDEDDILEKRMFDGIFVDGNRTFKSITHKALEGVWTFYGGEGLSKYYWETYVTFGDPSIELRIR